MVNVDLSREDLTFLFGQLEQQIAHIENELVHTDKREMQRELAQDATRLRTVLDRLERAAKELDEEASLRAADAP